MRQLASDHMAAQVQSALCIRPRLRPPRTASLLEVEAVACMGVELGSQQVGSLARRGSIETERNPWNRNQYYECVEEGS